MGRAWNTHLGRSNHCFPCIGAVITRHEKIIHNYTFSFTGTSSYESRQNTIIFRHGSTYYYWFIVPIVYTWCIRRTTHGGILQLPAAYSQDIFTPFKFHVSLGEECLQCTA